MSCKFEISPPPTSHCVITDADLAGRSLFIVGDIHGCLDEFQTLLNQANVSADSTLIICCGDLVNKGPKSCETVTFVRSLGSHAIRSVRGNHDEKVRLTALRHMCAEFCQHFCYFNVFVHSTVK